MWAATWWGGHCQWLSWIPSGSLSFLEYFFHHEKSKFLLEKATTANFIDYLHGLLKTRQSPCILNKLTWFANWIIKKPGNPRAKQLSEFPPQYKPQCCFL
jgi:hypothetical protein